MSKIWLVGMTQNRIDDFKEIVEYSDKYFDGMIFVDHFSDDGTFEILESHKGEGKIIQRPYVKQHSHSQNEILFCRHANNGDWMFLNDSPERIKPQWLDRMRQDIVEFEKEGIGAVVFSNRVYLWRYFDFQQFHGSPHWGLSPINGKAFSFEEENKDQFILNKRDEKPEDSYCLHPIRYWFVHSPSNEIDAMYSKYGSAVVESHRKAQIEFRMYCENELGMNLDSLDDLISYMEKVKSGEVTPLDYFVNAVESEFRLSELFQLKVLNMDFMLTMNPKRFQFSFKNWLDHGDGFHDPDYKGTTLLYDERLKELNENSRNKNN